MGLPGHRRTSSEGKVRAHVKRLRARILTKCPNCGAAVRPHIACVACGMYRGRVVVQQKVKKSKKAQPKAK